MIRGAIQAADDDIIPDDFTQYYDDSDNYYE
jgi:hypothetical protein